jgi:sugar-phosphatase
LISVNTKALLFDMDGVLIDSTPAVTRVWSQWAQERGLDPEEVVRRAHGRPSIATIRDLLPDADHAAENLVVETREIADLDGVVPLPGAVQLLHSLPEGRWTIVTSATPGLAEVRLRAAGLPTPRRWINSADITNGKPHPEPYLKGAAALGFPPSECIVVEDVPVGIRSGKSAGARVIALRTTAPLLDLRQAGPDWIAVDCRSIHLARVTPDELQLQLDVIQS